MGADIDGVEREVLHVIGGEAERDEAVAAALKLAGADNIAASTAFDSSAASRAAVELVGSASTSLSCMPLALSM